MLADGVCPNRRRESRIVFKSGDNMPVQVWNDIAQAGEVNLGRLKHLAHGDLDVVYHFHDFMAFGCRKVGHFGNMLTPNDAAECRRTAVVMDGNDAKVGGLQQNIFILCRADGTRLGVHVFLFLKVSKKAAKGVLLF